MKVQKNKSGQRNSITIQLIAVILAISSAVSVFSTGAQLVFEYKEELSGLENQLDLVEKSSVSSISQALWAMDQSFLDAQVDGIMRIPGVNFVEIREGSKVTISRGDKNREGSYGKKIELFYGQVGDIKKIGELKIQANDEMIKQHLFNRILILFITQFLKTIITSTLIFYFVKSVITDPLVLISKYLKQLKQNINIEELKISRKRLGLDDQEDEVDLLVREINSMKQKLVQSDIEINSLNKSLEVKVIQRTKELAEAQSVVTQQQQVLATTSKMSALGEMASGIAHEINNPLGIIAGRNNQLRRILLQDKIDTIKAQSIVDNVEKTTMRIARIVKGLRTFARDAKSDPLENTSIKTITEEAISLCEQRFRDHGISLSLEVLTSLDLYISCRPTEICQVLINLLGNAHDAVFNLADPWVKIRVSDVNGQVEIQIVDSGTRIPAEVRQKLFQPFFTTKEVGKGTGLGLSISLGIIQANGGTLSLDERLENTCFTIRLPKVADEISTKKIA